MEIEGKATRKVTYKIFKDILENYLIKHMKESIEIVDAVTNYTDPVAEYEKKFKPKTDKVLTAGLIEEMLLYKEVKIYVARKCNMQENVNKLYELIWGQCSDQIQSVIRMHPEFGDKSSDFKGIWLLRRVEEDIAGLSRMKNVGL